MGGWVDGMDGMYLGMYVCLYVCIFARLYALNMKFSKASNRMPKQD